MKRLQVMNLVKDILLVVGMLALGVLVAVAFNEGFILTLVSLYIILVGIYMIVHYFVNMKQLKSANTLIAGLMLFFAYGFALIMGFYEFFIYFLPILLGVAGGMGIGDAIQRKNEGRKDWWKKLIFGIVAPILAVLYILLMLIGFDPVIMAGVVIILVAICYCVERFLLRPDCEKAEKPSKK